MSKSTYPLKLPASVKMAAGLPDFVAGLHMKERIYTGAQMPEEFLNLRVPQMMRLLARKVQKYKELQERIQARRDK